MNLGVEVFIYSSLMKGELIRTIREDNSPEAESIPGFGKEIKKRFSYSTGS